MNMKELVGKKAAEYVESGMTVLLGGVLIIQPRVLKYGLCR